jgi:hypothetical protein
MAGAIVDPAGTVLRADGKDNAAFSSTGSLRNRVLRLYLSRSSCCKAGSLMTSKQITALQYVLANAKANLSQTLQKQEIRDDAGASHLEENMKAALSPEVLTINLIHKFARKARDDKLTYSYLVALADGEDASAAKDHIEHLIKLFKQHRSALNAEYKLIADA